MTLRTLLVGTDGSEAAARAVAWTASLARQLDAEAIAVHVFTVDPAKLPGGYVVLPKMELDRLRENSRTSLEGAWSEPLRAAGARYRTLLENGDAAGALIDAARREGADLIVVGSRGLGGFREMLLGSVGHHLTHHCPVPVAVVPWDRR